MPRQPGFPQKLYRLIPALYPHFAEILHSADISGPAFFAISYVKHSGREIEPGVVALPLADLKNLLLKVGEYKSESGAHGFITTYLENRLKFLEHRTITPERKRELFPDSPGYRDVVVLTETGQRQLDKVNKRVEALYADVTSGLKGSFGRAAFTAALKTFDALAGPLISRLESLTTSRDESENVGTAPENVN